MKSSAAIQLEDNLLDHENSFIFVTKKGIYIEDAHSTFGTFKKVEEFSYLERPKVYSFLNYRINIHKIKKKYCPTCKITIKSKSLMQHSHSSPNLNPVKHLKNNDLETIPEDVREDIPFSMQDL